LLNNFIKQFNGISKKPVKNFFLTLIKNRFEKELKNKLALKSSGHTSEETVLLKAFKYFDLDNSGNIYFNVLKLRQLFKRRIPESYFKDWNHRFHRQKLVGIIRHL
jgi:Ca2+-binding EF-hand superfamily protein